VTQPVSGTVTANAGSGTFFDGVVKDGTGDTTQANVSGGRLHVDLPALPAGSNEIGRVRVMDGTDTAQVTTTAGGSLQVECTSGCGGSGGTSIADGAVFTPDTTSLTPIGGYRDDTSPATVTEGDAAAARITEFRALHVNLRDASGAEVAVGGGTQYDEDTAATAAEKVTMAGVVRRDTASSLVDTDGDRTELIVDSAGRLHTAVGNTVTVTGTVTANAGSGTFFDGIVRDGTGDTTQANVSTGRLHVDGSGVTQPVSGTVTATQGSPPWSVAGPAADGAAVSGNPVRIGGKDGGGNTQDVATDTSGELQVDVLTLPALPAGANEIGRVRLTDGTDTAQVTATGGGSLQVECSAGCGGGTQYAEDTATGAGEQVTMAGVVRQDTPASLVDANNDRTVLSVDARGRLHTIGPFNSVSDTITADEDSVSLALNGAPGAGFALTGTWVATLIPEVSLDSGTTWTAMDVWSLGGEAATQSLAANGQFLFMALAGVTNIRVRADAYTSGTATVALQATPAPSVPLWGAERVPGSTIPNHAVLIGGADSTTLRSVKVDAAGELQVDVLSLPALPAGTNNIGDVDVLSFPDNEPFNLAQVAGTATAVNNGAASAGTQRVTLASDSTGNVATIGTSVTPGTSAAHLGKAEDAAAGSGDTGVAVLVVREDTPTATASNGEYIAPKANQFGHQFTASMCNDPNLTTTVNIDQTSLNGNAELVALTSNQTIYVCGFSLSVSATANVRLVYGTGTACATGETGMFGPYYWVANQGISHGGAGAIIHKAAISNALCLETSASTNVGGHVQYVKGQFP
jgi:hypothetical protein